MEIFVEPTISHIQKAASVINNRPSGAGNAKFQEVLDLMLKFSKPAETALFSNIMLMMLSKGQILQKGVSYLACLWRRTNSIHLGLHCL